VNDVVNQASESGSDSLLALGYRVWLALAYLLLALLCGLGISMEFSQIDENIETLARERGAVLFRLVELTRDWNARHGGVYVPVTEATQPNPYLKHPRRDLLTTDGQRLTMVNPAFMTRQIAEIAEQADGVKYHITSLNPIRPANAPDTWELEALKSFEAGKREALSLLQTEKGMMHRYMAPLFVKPPCLACHAEQGYKLGEIRGGISVSMPAGNMLAIRTAQRTRIMLVFGTAALMIVLLMHFAIRRSRQYVLHLQAVTAGQEELIAERTQALSKANEQLLEEVVERKRKEMQISESEARYRSVIETSQNAILIMQAPDFVILFANEQGAALVGLAPSQMLNRPLLDFVCLPDRSLVAERLERRARGEPVSPTVRLHFCRQDGSNVRVGDVHVARIDSASEHPQWVLSVHDVTDRLADERALQISAAVMENAAEGIVVTDAQNRIIQVNPAFSAITGYRPQEVLGKDPGFLGSGRHERGFFREMWDSLEKEGHWAGEIWNRRPDGTVYVVWLAISSIHGEGAETGGRHVATFIDITQRKEVEELLRHRAQSDPLTDLPNRTLFYDRLQVALTHARRYEEEFALLYIDLDHFKNVNDTLGHAAGDELLIEASHRLTQAVRQSDTVARLGGDEFAVILPKAGSQSEIEEVAQRVVEAMVRPFFLSAGTVNISTSVGVAIYPRHGEDLETIRACADAALYSVKQSGRNGYRLYMPVSR
jgi:diguanylate cyclase (GGDEF)-like protein/PAS domain S-box-containing protein